MEWWTVLGWTVTATSFYRLSDAFAISWNCEIFFNFNYRMDENKEKILVPYKEHKKDMYLCVATMGLDWYKVIESEPG